MESAAKKIPLSIDIDDASTAAPENIALLGADSASMESRKKGGVFYTPVAVVDEILSATLGAALKNKSLAEILAVSILDPACGSGIFLIRAQRIFMRELSERGCSPEIAEEVVRNCIYGVDLDTRATTQAAQLLVACARQYSPTIPDDAAANIRCGNSLLDPTQFGMREIPADLNPFAWSEQFPQVFRGQNSGFDFVVGNPPYGLSRGEQISPRENALLQKAFEASRQGKINKYLAFIALGFRLLRSKGELSFIVPNSWLGISGAKKIRTLLLQHKALHNLWVYDYPVFGDPSVEAVVFKVKKDQANEHISISRRGRQRLNSAAEVRVPVATCLADQHCKIPLLWNEALAPLLHTLNSIPMRIGSAESPFLPMIALQAYACGKGQPPQTASQVKEHCFHSNDATLPDAYPYYEGGDIGRYMLRWSGQYLRHGKFLAEPQQLSRFSGPRVVLREILSPPPNLLSASYIDATALYNKSVLHIISKDNSQPELMQALCALLNSKLISFFIRMCGCKSQRSLFPKVVNEDIRSIPLAKDFFLNTTALAALCQRQLACTSAENDRAIDDLIFSIYGVDEDSQHRAADFLRSAKND